ncbi:MAG: phosphoglycerate dehydrogenase, partial [Desulfatibacillaceae bacterium]|nr:phosphoglycerate dehydrogenase [Desulfatibacillaceae bacterium]
MKVLVSDKLGDAGVKLFEEAQGISVDVKTGLAPEELEAIIGEYDGLVIRSATKVTTKILAAAKRLKVVGRAGTGLDNVDIPEATKRGVVVMNTPGGNTVTTAEHAIALMLALSRKIPQGTSTMKAGAWEKKKLEGREIFNKVYGVVGFGNIGKIVADRGKGLRMQVIVHDPFISPEVVEKAGFESVSFDEMLARADYITIHVPKTKETADLFNKDSIAKMKTGAMLINCARGGIVNEADLAAALKSGKLAGAALDVFATEPPPADNPLLGLDNLICTPHLGASTAEAQTNVAVAVADQIIDYLLNGTIRNAVNAPSVAGEVLKKIKPMLILGERMGCLQAQLATEPVSAISVEYAGDFKDLDLAPVTTALLKGFLEPALKDDVNYVNANVIAKERGITVSESRVGDAPVYSHLITVCAAGANTKHTVSGTIVGKAEPKIVAIDSFRMEMVPQGHILLVHNEDKPGAIGAIATVLGDANINIARMSVGQ